MKSSSLVKDIAGLTFGRLSVIKQARSDKDGNACWVCRCSCGRQVIAVGRYLRRGQRKSCGCLGTGIGLRARKHGHCVNYRRSPVYDVWMNMHARCRNPKHESFPRYGGRGIRVCKRWAKFENFLSDMGERPSHKHSIDRINGDGNYEPSNCRWATRSEQMKHLPMTPKRLAALRRNAAIARRFTYAGRPRRS